MKTTKKILASLLAIMMLAMMIPFSASAADGYTATYKCNPSVEGDYTFSFFKIADLDLKEGKYNVVTALKDTAVETAINGKYDATKTQSIITACDALYDTNSAFDTAATSISFSETVTENTVTLTDAGIYYIYCTDKPATVTGVNNSLVALPYYSNKTWVDTYTADVDLATKIRTSPVTVTKTADKVNIGDNDPTVTYTLTASTTGSMQNKLTTYAIVDTMDAGLTLKDNTFVVTLENADGTSTTLAKDTDYKILKNCKYKDAGDNEKTATFAVVLTKSMLNSEAFYNAKTVKVVYEADINDNAQLATAMPNSDGLVYGNSSDVTSADNINDASLNYEDGNTVNVFTYGMKVTKVDGTTNEGLSETEFTVYTDAEATKELTVDGKKVVAVTDANGEAKFKLEGSTVDFKFDADSTYYVKETKAHDGYTICDTIFTVNIDTNNGYTSASGSTPVKNYPVVIPQTGGMGTMVFTIGGALLIACAGVLLFIVRRNKNA